MANSFKEIIEFAINREKEAVKFYIDLQSMVKFKAQKEVLKEFELMEQGHVTLLEGVAVNKGFKTDRQAPEDLKLNEFLVESPKTDEMTYQDILITAIKREERSSELYTRMKNETVNEEIRAVFERLVTEELQHKHHFETIYDEEVMTDN